VRAGTFDSARQDSDPELPSLREQRFEGTPSYWKKPNSSGQAVVQLSRARSGGSYLQRYAVHTFTQGAVATPAQREIEAVLSVL